MQTPSLCYAATLDSDRSVNDCKSCSSTVRKQLNNSVQSITQLTMKETFSLSSITTAQSAKIELLQTAHCRVKV